MTAEGRTFDRPRGTRDFGPAEMAKRRWLEGVFRETFRRHGYREVQTPIFEHTDLFRAKSGPNVVDEIYTFLDKAGREICLRPELTAPVLRYYVNDLSMEPKPLKLYYYGQCYRYEEPQEGRYREFFQFGLELLGPEGPNTTSQRDAEVVAVACAALKAAGLSNYTLHLGHIGVLRALMRAVVMNDEATARVYRAIDKDDPELPSLLPDHFVASPEVSRAIVKVASHVKTLDPGDAIGLERYFAEVEELADRLASVPADRTTIPLLPIADTIRAAGQELKQTTQLLAYYGIPRVQLDLGVARGLDYYTGMVFEIESPDLGAQKQIGGGGAYSLAEVFGGEHTGSAGFGLGFDRILLALEKEKALPPTPPAADVYVAYVGNRRWREGLSIAQDLRAYGISVDSDIMGRTLGKALQHATKVGARFALIIGEKDLDREVVTLRDLSDGSQQEIPVASAAKAVAQVVRPSG